VLADATKSTGAVNYNNINYVDISSQYLHDFIGIATHDPSVYLHGVWVGLQLSVYPSDDYAFFLTNRAKLGWWARDYDAAVLLQTRERVVDGVPAGTAWGLIAYYVVALILGAAEMVRVLLRRGGSPALAFVWLLLAYATTVLTLAEIEENQRVRFVADPLVLILVCIFVARIVPRMRHLVDRRQRYAV
jgi:hypothetical protein